MDFVSGAAGNVVWAEWKGKQVLKKKPVFSRNRKFSLAQQVQHAKFALAHQLFRRFTTLFQSSFEDTNGQTGRGQAIRHLLDNAILGDFPNFSVDYSKVLVAKGGLINVLGSGVVSDAPGMLRYSWTDSAVRLKANPTDVAILVAYCEELNLVMYTVTGPTRIAMSAELEMPFFSGKEVQTWIAFRSEKGDRVSDSSYTGAVIIQ